MAINVAEITSVLKQEIAGFEPIAEGEESVSADLEAHTYYTFLCTVPGHAEAGMEGELIVK